MAKGEIHNLTGTICKAEIKCPIEGGHSASDEDFIEYHEAAGADGAFLRTMLADGTPPKDALEVLAMNGSYTSSFRKAVKVENVYGREIEIIPGVIDENAKGLYRTGQCMALAVSLAEKMKGKVIVMHDVDGNIVHAFAYKSGVTYDIDGPTDLKDIKRSVRKTNSAGMRRNKPDLMRKLKAYSPNRLRSLLEKGSKRGFQRGSFIGGIQEQNYDLADKFAENYSETYPVK